MKYGSNRELLGPFVPSVNQENRLRRRNVVEEELKPSVAHNISAAVDLRGAIDPDIVDLALAALVRRHTSLRMAFSAFSSEGRARIMAWIAPPQELRARRLSLRMCASERAAEEQVRRLAAEDARQPFCLDTGGLLRATLVELNPERSILILTVEHLATDLWGIGVLVRDFAISYEGCARKQADFPSLSASSTPQFAEWAANQRNMLLGERGAKLLAFWQHEIGQMNGIPDLPIFDLMPRREHLCSGRTIREVSRDSVLQLRRLAAECRASPFMIMLASLFLCVGERVNGASLGAFAPFVNRTSADDWETVGWLSNLLVLRAPIDEGTFRKMVAATRRVVLNAHANEALPLPCLVQHVQPERHTKQRPILYMEFGARDEAPLAGLTAITARRFPLEGSGGMVVPGLAVRVSDEGDTFLLTMQYAAHSDAEWAAEELADRWIDISDAVGRRPDQLLVRSLGRYERWS